MHKDEFAFILDCIEFVAAYGRRFLPLYHFNWVTGDWTFKNRALKYHFMKEDLTFGSSDFASSCRRQRERDGNQKRLKISRPANRLRGYLESARRIVLRLPEYNQAMVVPEDIDPRMVLFRL